MIKDKENVVMKMMNSNVIIVVVIGIVILEAIALSKGINGIILTIVIATLAGLGGWVVPAPELK